MRTKYRIDHRFNAFFMAMVVLLTSLNMLAYVLPTVALDEETPITIREDALHFFIRHWHTDEDNDAEFNPDQSGDTEEDYFVVVEGYIMADDHNPGKYVCYFVNQDDLSLIPSDSAESSPYIESFDPTTGTVVLKTKPLMDGNDPLETFAGISVSAGFDAVKYDSAGITITYDPAVTLVKGHVFYRHMSMVVTGTVDEKAFADTGLFDDPQIDTAWAYTYATAMRVGEEDKQIGDLIMSASDPSKACTKVDELPDYCFKFDDDGNKIVNDSVVGLTKFYSTAVGLHTDKTLMQTADGRLFLYSLEAWYIEGLAPQIGLILDASGSMGFAAETPSAIYVNSIIRALRDAGRNGEADALANKVGAMRTGPQEAAVYPRLDKLIGYYQFDGSAEAMTYVLDVADLPEGTINDGSYGTAKFFTLYTNNSSVESADMPNFEDDPTGYVGTKRISFGGTSDVTQRSIQFTISRAATLKVWWEANIAKEERALRILSERGDVIGTSVYDKPGTGHYYNIHLEPGTYSISGITRKDEGKAMFIYKAEVEEDPIPSAGDPMTNGAPGYEANKATRVEQADFSNGNFAFSGEEDSSAGLSVGDSGLDYSADVNYGVLLDAKPTMDGGFTVSFTLTSTGVSTSGKLGNLADILYIGALSGNTATANYYRGYRNSGSSSARFAGGNGGYNLETSTENNPYGKATNILTNINQVYTNSTSTHVITLVFTADSVTSYMDGEIGVNSGQNYAPNDGSNNGVAFTDDIRIVIDGIQDTYSKDRGTLSIDNVFVYDTALYSDDVKKLYNAVNDEKSLDDKETNWDNVFLSLSEQALILNPNNTDNSALGAAGYNYFVYDPRPGTNAYTPLGYYNRTLISPDVTLNNVAGEGWYYSSYSNQKKTLRGIGSGITNSFIDSIDPEIFSTSNVVAGAAPDAGKNDIPGAETVKASDTGKVYTPTGDSAVKLYIDAAGYLRSFFTTGNNINAFTSYVYELRDDQYVRTEALQRALGSFLNKLTDQSPSALISAIGYNNQNTAKDLLGEETSDSAKAIDLMKNYPLNGGTNTTSGLKMFADKYMKGKNNKTVGDKFVIIFTDGNDDVYNAGDELADNATVKLATQLKKEGYTVYTVMLASGSLNKDNEATKDSYEKARKFLCALAGTEDVTVEPEKDGEEGIGYDNKTGKSTGSKYFYAPTTVDQLAESFVVEILKNIAKELEGYTVQDYIDPRFDLLTASTDPVLDEDGNPVLDENGNAVTEEYIWKLQAEGKVEKVKKSDGKTVDSFIVNKTTKRTIPLSGQTIPDARKPYLRYDAGADMFYLQWVNQTIPTSAVGASRLEIWYAEVWVRAKADFIGGNAVLVGGNAEKMNWVYHPGDLPKTDVVPRDEDSDYDPTDLFGHDASSGTEDAEKTYKKDANGNPIVSQPIDAYPSKGFPRVVANVALLPIHTNPVSSVIYMGEAVSPKQILTEIKDAYMTETYYLEYLKRFAYARYDVGKYHPDLKKQMDRPLLDLLTEWLEIENDSEKVKAFSVPYMYLPAVEWDEESGKIALNDDGSAKTIYNNVGDVKTNQRCIVGVLTYRWEQLDPLPETNYEPIKDYVKTDTDRVIYSLTVEFTPLRVGDTYALFYGSDDSDDDAKESEIATIATTAEGYPILSIDGTGDSESDPVTYAETGIFEKYLRIDDNHKAEVQEDTRLDREKYINGNLDVYGNIINPDVFVFDESGNRVDMFFDAKGNKVAAWNSYWVDAEGKPRNEGSFLYNESGKQWLDSDGNVYDTKHPDAPIGQVDHRGSYALISDTTYKWNKAYKPAVGDEELVYFDIDPEDSEHKYTQDKNYPYGDAYMVNDRGTEEKSDYRTLKATSTYTADVVSGGIELELKILIGELKEALDTTGNFQYEFTVPATRSFRDTEIVEELKKTKYNGEKNEDDTFNPIWEDYGEDFEITFAFDYDTQAIAALELDMEDHPEKYPDGYVTIYAKIKSIKALKANFTKTVTDADGTTKTVLDRTKSENLTELPIGTYEIEFDEINDKLPTAIKDTLHFAEVEVDNENDLSLKHFQQDVLNGLHTTKNGKTWSGSEKRGADGKIIKGANAGSYEPGDAEINKDNIDDFRAAGTTAPDKSKVTFYIGTALPDDVVTQEEAYAEGADEEEEKKKAYEPERGKVPKDPYVSGSDHYINQRLGMLRMSTGMTLLTIEEQGGMSNESFIYRITGTTLGGKEVVLTVSVQGGSSTTVALLPGEYTVTELPYWSWRYENKDTYGKHDADKTSPLYEGWQINRDDLTKATVSLRYKDDLPENDGHETFEEHKTVIYEHTRNKVWLGGENHEDNHFDYVEEQE